VNAVRVVIAVGGFIVLAGTTSSVLRTLVVPRGVSSWLAEHVLDGVVRLSRMIGDRVRDFERRDSILAWAGPLALATLLGSWLGAFTVGYALVDIGFGAHGAGDAFRQAGSSVATLGFAASTHAGLTVIDIFTGTTGMIVIALQIAYLPTLYSAYNQRETLVTLLAARGGEPAYGPEILARHAWLGLLDNMAELYGAWERWAATVSESHTSYPVLIHFRSPKPLRSWLVSLLAVMDAAALQTAVAPSTAPVEARLVLRMGYLTLRDIALIEGIPTRSDPSPDDDIALSFDEFAKAVDSLALVGMPIERSAEEAWPHFRGWRVNYEDAAYGLAEHIDAVPALWSGPRRRREEPIPPVRPTNRQPRGAQATPRPDLEKADHAKG